MLKLYVSFLTFYENRNISHTYRLWLYSILKSMKKQVHKHKYTNWTGCGVIFFAFQDKSMCLLCVFDDFFHSNLDVPAWWSKQLDLDQRAEIIMDQALVSDDVFRRVWEGQALLEML